MLLQRVLTALVLLALFLGLLLAASPGWFFGLCTAVLVAAAWESAAMAGLPSRAGRTLFVMVFLALGAALLWLGDFTAQQSSSLASPLFALAVLFWLLILALVLAYPRAARLWALIPMRMVFALATLLFAGLAIVYLRSLASGQFWVIYVVVTVAAADVGGYFVGRALGRRKLASRLSPGKSWEGVLGGIALALLFAPGFHWVYASSGMLAAPAPLGMTVFLLIAVLLSASSVLGDLFESLMKRNAGVKDSGSLLPGHGGVLDRIDGLTAALPLFALISIVLGL